MLDARTQERCSRQGIARPVVAVDTQLDERHRWEVPHYRATRSCSNDLEHITVAQVRV